MKKYSLIEFVAANESEDFNNIEKSWLNWSKEFVPELLKQEGHQGDCTKHSHPCNLCVLENILEKYKKYYFNEKENNNGCDR